MMAFSKASPDELVELVNIKDKNRGRLDKINSETIHYRDLLTHDYKYKNDIRSIKNNIKGFYSPFPPML